MMLGLSLAYDIEPNIPSNVELQLVVGLTTLATLVLLRSMIVRHRINAGEIHSAPEGLELPEDPATDPELR